MLDGSPLPPHLKGGLISEYERLQAVNAQLRAAGQEINELVENEEGMQAARSLMLLSGVGPEGMPGSRPRSQAPK